MARAMKEAEAIVAASDKRYADIRANRERDLANDLDIAASRSDAAKALEQENKKAFEAMRKSVNMLPSVMSSSAASRLGIGADMNDAGTATAMRILKSKGAGATALGGGKFSTTGITGKEVIVTLNVYGNIMGEDTEDIVSAAAAAAAQRGGYERI